MKKQKFKNTLRAMVKHLGLKLVFVDYLPDEDHGRLLPRERRILINAKKPRNEHFYTILHEIAHFVLHFKNPNRKRNYGLFSIDLPFHWQWWTKICSHVRRHFRFAFNRKSGKEWEADLWATCAFIYLAKTKDVRCRRELAAFMENHPEKWKFFLLGCAGMAWGRIKTGYQKVSKIFSISFKMA